MIFFIFLDEREAEARAQRQALRRAEVFQQLFDNVFVFLKKQTV